MEDVIYGVILNAKIESCSKEPPVIALKKSYCVTWAKKPAICVRSIPGTGSWEPSLITISAINVNNNL